MKACILVFSPSGHTLMAGEKLEEYLKKEGFTTQFVNMTGKKEYSLEKCDVICIGGPVYGGHMESNVLKAIRNLPKAAEYGRFAVPFVTYGGLHSSIALEEAGEELVKTGRTILAGMKVASFHTLSKTLKRQINVDRPGTMEENVIRELAERIGSLLKNPETVKSVEASFMYAPEKQRELFHKMSQDDFHEPFRKVTVQTDSCVGCGACVAHCPVNRFEIKDGKSCIRENAETCILCGECFHQCPIHAVDYPYINQVRERLETTEITEYPQSAVYPLNS